MWQSMVWDKTMQEKKFGEPILTNLRDIQVATWKFRQIFCGYFIWEFVVQKSFELMTFVHILQNKWF